MAPPLFRLYLAVSADGFIAPPDGGVDWLKPYPPAEFGFDSFLTEIDTIVMGRTTYDQNLSFGSWPFKGKRTIVLTSRPLDTPPPDVRHWHGELTKLAAELKSSASGDVWLFGGAKSVRPFLDGGLVDRIELYVIPILLGNGIPLFERSDRRVALRLEEAHSLSKGVLQVVYSPLST